MAGGRGFREREDATGKLLPGAVETEARTLAVAGSALEAGAAHKARESKSAEGIIKQAALTSLLAAGHSPHHGRG